MKPKLVFTAIVFLTAVGFWSCSDSRPRSPIAPEGVGDPLVSLIEGVPERGINKWARASEADLKKAVEAAGGRVIVGIKEPGSPRGVYRGRVLTSPARYESAKATLVELGVSVVHEYKLSPSLVAKIDPDLAGVVRKLEWIDYLEPDSPGRWMSQDTTWNVQKVGAPYGWAVADGDGVDLLIIDSGIDSTNADLNPASVHACDGSNGLDLNGHGTFVSGIAAAVDNWMGVVGVAPGVDLRSSRVGTSAPSVSTVKCAIEYGRTNDFFVMSMSLEVSDTLESLTDEIEAAWDDGHILVAPAGDSGQASVGYPAYLPEVIAVTPVKQDNGFWGPEDTEVELAAPGGVDIASTGADDGEWPYDTAMVVLDDGIASSWAVPQVAAAAAMLKEHYPSWTNDDIRDELQETAVDLGTSGWDNRYGYGLLDITAALGITPLSSVSISGPDEVQPEDENCTWTASVTGGVSPFTYTWRYDGYWVSSSSSWTGGLNPLDQDEEFTLTVWVSDQGNRAVSDTLHVTADEGAWWCTYKR